MQNDHNFFMRKCLELAGKAKRNGKTGVGSLIVRGRQILGEGEEGGHELPAHMAHAELLAINHAIQSGGKSDLSDCILYTTVEPCVMCSYIIRNTRISYVVIGASTGGVGGVSSRYPILIADDIAAWGKPPSVLLNILEEECQRAV
ncbi:MAG: nucleoside deaminase [Chryseolinea sp.]